MNTNLGARKSDSVFLGEYFLIASILFIPNGSLSLKEIAGVDKTVRAGRIHKKR